MANGSKYIKSKGAQSNSKYIKNKNPNASNSTNHEGGEGLSGRARYLEMLEREREIKDSYDLVEDDSRTAERRAKREAAKKQVEAERKKAAKQRAATLKVTNGVDGANVAFSSEVKAKPLANEDEDEKLFRKITIRNLVTCSIIGVIALLLQIGSFNLPLVPNMIRVDLAVVPELLAAIAFGPIAGVAIIVAKNAFYILIFGNNVLATAISNVILDSLFVFIASAIYARGMFSPRAIQEHRMRQMEDPDSLKGTRRRMVTKSGLIGALITTPISYFTAMYIVYPLIFRMFGSAGYSAEYFVVQYNDALRAFNTHLPSPLNSVFTEITTLSQGVLMYNLPIMFVKMVLVTLFVAIIFKPLSKILFYHPPVDPKE